MARGVSRVAFVAHLREPCRASTSSSVASGVVPETAWMLPQAMNTTPEFRINLQAAYDLD